MDALLDGGHALAGAGASARSRSSTASALPLSRAWAARVARGAKSGAAPATYSPPPRSSGPTAGPRPGAPCQGLAQDAGVDGRLAALEAGRVGFGQPEASRA